MKNIKEKQNDSRGKGEVIIYATARKGPEISVRLEDETVWLTQKQMAELFNKDVRTINEHIKNVFKEGELEENPSIRKFRIVQMEGNRRVERDNEFYNLDVIISIGYRVKSQRGTQFRIWANKIVKEYLVQGYAVNEKRLAETRGRLDELQQTILFLQEKAGRKMLAGQAGEILNLLSQYAKTLSVLEQYDTGTLADIAGKKSVFVLEYAECIKIIAEVKKELTARGEAGDLFGAQRGGTFEGIIKGLYQAFGGKELYPTIEDKASHILYLTIKDHPFSDGNKRMGSFLFVYFLDQSYYLLRKNGERKINDNALAALALLVAESDPKEKDIIIRLIKNLLME